MSNYTKIRKKKTPRRELDERLLTNTDGSETPHKLTKTKTIKPNTNPRNSGRRREWNYSFHISQEELKRIPIYCPISIKQEKYLNDETNDIVVWGGSAGAGKTQLSLLKVMKDAFFDIDYTAGIARKSQRQMKQAGSLWSEGVKMFTPHGVSSNRVEMQWSFPIGSEVRCHHLDNNPDDWQGSQLTKIIVDEAQQCEEDDVWYLTSRLRSRSKVKNQLLLTCNPLNTSFLRHWLMESGYVGEDGLPVKEMDGVTTYMLQVGGSFKWYKTKQEVVELYGEEVGKFALSFVFYAANVYDNPFIRKYQPDYVFKLENLKQVEKDRLLYGNWLATPQGMGFVSREQVKEVPLRDVPLDCHRVRAWDLAGTKPHEANRNPDYTRGVLGTLDKESGNFYVLDVCTLRDNHAVVQGAIEGCVLQDGKETYVSIPIDSGSAGRAVAEQKKARLMSMGAKVVLEPTRQSKLVRAEPLLMAMQEGKVFVVQGVLSGDDYSEIEAFDGGKNSGQKDDLIDAMASCYNNLVSGNLIPTIRIGANSVNRNNFGGRTLL